jgi:hypothetical protein
MNPAANPAVLLDSSAWIEVARGTADPALREEVAVMLSEGLAALAAPVWLELYRGVRSEKEERWLAGLRELCQWLPFDEECWSAAAEAARRCTRTGVHVPTSDILVFCVARRHRARLLHRDRHFDLIARALAR